MPSDIAQTYTVDSTQAGQRLDIFCVAQAPDISRSVLQKAIKGGQITVNGVRQKPRYLLKEGDVVVLSVASQEQPPQPVPPSPAIPAIYEDKDIVVINKPAGLVTHPGQAQEQISVSRWFAEHFPDSADIGDPGRPGIVHRLDKDTSGVMVLAKTPQAFTHLKKQFKLHHPQKEYLALVFGVPGEPKGRITRPLARSRKNPLRRTVVSPPAGGGARGGGSSLPAKSAITEWAKEESYGDYALLRVFLLTGRMHQIRAHLHFLGYPIVGDALYTFKRQKQPQGVQRQLLHAEKLSLRLLSGKIKTFVAELPDDFTAVIQTLPKSAM